MKLLILLLFSFLLCEVFAAQPQKKMKQNPSMATEFMVNKQKMKSNGDGLILAKFIPAPGIHFNAEILPEFYVDSLAPVFFSGDAEIPKIKKKGKELLDERKPVTQKFAVKKNAKKGTYTIKATCTYFYCSEKEGWCNRFTVPFEFLLVIE